MVNSIEIDRSLSPQLKQLYPYPRPYVARVTATSPHAEIAM